MDTTVQETSNQSLYFDHQSRGYFYFQEELDEGIKWFVKTLEDEFKVKIDRSQISYEGNELYLDEIDESVIPNEMIKELPEQLMFETMMFNDSEGTEWIGAIVSHPDSRQWLLQIILKDAKPVLRKLIEKEYQWLIQKHYNLFLMTRLKES